MYYVVATKQSGPGPGDEGAERKDMYEDNFDDVWVKNANGDYFYYEEAVEFMNDDYGLCEEIHREFCPCSPQKFFEEYGKAYEKRFGEEWPPYSGYWFDGNIYERAGITADNGIIGKDGEWRPSTWYNHHPELDPELDEE